jgi:hypothetical protein
LKLTGGGTGAGFGTEDGAVQPCDEPEGGLTGVGTVFAGTGNGSLPTGCDVVDCTVQPSPGLNGMPLYTGVFDDIPVPQLPEAQPPDVIPWAQLPPAHPAPCIIGAPSTGMPPL